MNKSVTISLDFIPKRVFDFWHFNMESESRMLNHSLNGFLFKWDPHRNRKLGLLKKPPYIIKSDKGDYVVYTLRDDIKWQDGHAITSQDFEFWLEVYQSDLNTNKYDAWANTKIEIESSVEFRILFKEPYVFKTLSNLIQPAPKHLLKAIWENFLSDTKELSKEDQLAKWNQLLDKILGLDTALPLSSGPFVISDFSDNNIKLVKNPYFYSDVDIETLNFVVQEDNKLKAINDNKVDICNMSDFNDRALPEKYKQVKVNTNTWITILINHFWLARIFNNKSDQYTFKKILNNLIVSSDLVDMMEDNTITRAYSFVDGFSQKSPTIQPEENIYELLHKYDYYPNSDGMFKDFPLTFSIPNSSIFYKKLAKNIAKIFQRSGLVLKINEIDDDIFYSKEFLNHASDFKFSLIPIAYQGDPLFEKGEIFSSIKSGSNNSNIPTNANNFIGENISGFKNADYDAYFLKLSMEQDMKQREKYLYKLANLSSKYVSSISLFNKEETWLISSDIQNVDFNSVSGTITWNVEEWKR